MQWVVRSGTTYKIWEPEPVNQQVVLGFRKKGKNCKMKNNFK